MSLLFILGWTVLGWVIALVWASTAVKIDSTSETCHTLDPERSGHVRDDAVAGVAEQEMAKKMDPDERNPWLEDSSTKRKGRTHRPSH